MSGDLSPLTVALVQWAHAEAAAALKQRGLPEFMGKPDSWYDTPHWFCENGHVSGRFLKSEEHGSLCLACRAPVVLGPMIGETAFASILNGLRQLVAGRQRRA